MNGQPPNNLDRIRDQARIRPTATSTFQPALKFGHPAAKHRRGQDNILLLEVDTDALGDLGGDALKWEASRGGALFPHLYGELPVTAAINVTPLELDDDGVHIFPDGFPPPGTE